MPVKKVTPNKNDGRRQNRPVGYERATNAELQARVKELEEELADLKSQVAAVTPAKAEPVEEEYVPQPTAWDLEEAEHAEKVRPYIEAWEEKIEALYRERAQRYMEGAGLNSLTVMKEQRIRDDVIREHPYDGPERDLYRYKRKIEREAFEQEKAERQSKSKAGLPSGMYRDPFGFVRDATTGKRVPGHV